MANYKFTETSYIEAFWFIGGPGVAWDWTACVYRDTPEEPWRLSYRWRYHNPESEGRSVHQHRDRFAPYHFRAQGDDPSLPQAFCEMVEIMVPILLARDPRVTVERFVIRGGVDKWTDMMTRQPFIHVRDVREGETS